MKRRKPILLLCLSLLLTLSACGKKHEAYRGIPYTVALESAVGSGYFWDCTLSESGIVRVESEMLQPENAEPGTMFTTEFRFYGEKHGDVSATLCCHRSWDNSVCYLHTCELSVDRDKLVTGELSEQTVRIIPGEGSYQLTASDTSIALWTNEEDGSYLFTPLRDGMTTLTFASQDASLAPTRVFYLSVAEDGSFSVSEETGLMPEAHYSTVKELEQRLGIPMLLPADGAVSEISSVDAMAYTSFTWHGIEFAYVGGDLDPEAFRSPGSEVLTLGECDIMISNGVGTVAAWERDGHVYCISSDVSIPTEDLQELLKELLASP